MAFVSHTSGRGSAATTAASSLATSSQTPTGNSLLVCATLNKITAGTPAAPTLSSTFTVTWTQYATFTYNSGSGANDTRLSIFYGVTAATPGSGTTTVDCGGVSQSVLGIAVDEFADAALTGSPAGSDAMKQSKTVTGTASSLSSTLNNALQDTNSFVYLEIAHAASEGITAGSGFTVYRNHIEPISDSQEGTTTPGSATTALAASWTTNSVFGALAIEIAGPAIPSTFVPKIVGYQVV